MAMITKSQTLFHPLPLETRERLPDALRVLVEKYPRDIWEGHENFDGLVKFWLERHMMFRKLLGLMKTDIEQFCANSLESTVFRQRIARLGNMFVGELHMHHNVEDHQYFPILKRQEPRLERGFEILDHDHHAIDGHLELFTNNANAVLEASEKTMTERSENLHEQLIMIEGFLNRHLTDEEELVVPIVLKYGAYDQ